MRVNIKFRLLTDRQDLIDIMQTREAGLEPYMMDRLDMYWADVSVKDEGLSAELTYSIDPSHDTPGKWRFMLQYGPVILDHAVREKLALKWEKSTEKASADMWVQRLINAGYFRRGRAYAPESPAVRCPHCNALFARGTSHHHVRYEGRIVHHHGKMEREAKRRGLKRTGISSFDPDKPSLEEKGKLQEVVI